MSQPNHYMQKAVQGTRQLVGTTYQKFSHNIFRAPAFLENTVQKIDQTVYPYVEQITLVVDQRVDNAVERLTPLTQQVKTQTIEKYTTIANKGRQLQQDVHDKSQQLLNGSVEIAINNKASQAVISSANTLTDLLFSSVEDKVHQLSDLLTKQKTEKSNEKKTYQARMIDLAQSISNLSNQMYGYLKQEAQNRQEGQKVTLYFQKARTVLEAHFHASTQVVKLTIYTPTIEVVSKSKEDVKNYLVFLKKQYTDQQLLAYIKQQYQESKAKLTKEQLQNVIQALREINLLQRVTEIIKEDVHIYKQVLAEDQKEQQ